MTGAKIAPRAKSAMSVSASRLSGSRRIGPRARVNDPLWTGPTPPSATLDPGVEPVIGDVDDEVRDGVDDRGEQRHAEHGRKVEAPRRRGRVPPEPGPAEDRLGQHRTRKQAAEGEADDGDRRDEG